VRCEELDHEVERFRTRSLSSSCYPYSWLDATFLKQRQQGRASTQAVVLATLVNAAMGLREVLGLEMGHCENSAYCWLSFLRGLMTCGPAGVQLVVSDAHVGLQAAISSVLHRAS
jgi:putative transposase